MMNQETKEPGKCPSTGFAQVSLANRSGERRTCMAEYGEWNQKRATLSDVTAKSEYGVSRDFIIEGIEAGRLEYRDGAIWGNPYIRLLRSQLEKYITEKLGEGYLVRVKGQAELRMIKKEISVLRKRLTALNDRKAVLEQMLEAQRAQGAQVK
jgi:hypothetical protein